MLTAAQGARLRNRIGDTVSGDYKLSDTELDTIYTEQGSDLDLSTVAALQELLGIYAMSVDVSDPQGDVSEMRSQRYEALEKLLEYWESKTGTSGSALSVGLIDYNIDTDVNDLDQ